jgi:hypothetical protein
VGNSVRALTLHEVATLTSQLTGRPCTARRVRYLLVTGGLGSDTQRRPHGRTRLFGALDVALVRLALALEENGLSPWLSRVVITYLRDDLVRAWKTTAPLGVAVRGLQATLEPALKGRPVWSTVWVPLREIWRGLDSEVQRTSDGRDDVWMYRRVRVGAVPRNTV